MEIGRDSHRPPICAIEAGQHNAGMRDQSPFTNNLLRRDYARTSEFEQGKCRFESITQSRRLAVIDFDAVDDERNAFDTLQPGEFEAQRG